MKIKNTSTRIINLKSGKLKSGESGEATHHECKVLFSSGMVEEAKEVKAKPFIKKVKIKTED